MKNPATKPSDPKVGPQLVRPVAVMDKARKRNAEPVFKTVSLYETFHKEFAGEVFVIQGILSTGANNLSADPKSGKSYLCLQIASCVAQKRALFGYYKVTMPGPVLYLALEDGERRIHNRMHEMGMYDRDLHNVQMIYDISRSLSSPEGKKAVEDELKRAQEAGNPYVLLIVDTLAAACDESGGGGTEVFRKQYQEMKYFQNLAEKFNLAALISMHNRKGEGRTALEKIGGTFGRSAAVNGNMILDKREDRTILQIRSRDTKDADIALRFSETGGHALLTQAEVQMKDIDRDIFNTVTSHGPISSTDVALRLNRDRGNTSRRMSEMATRGELTYDEKKKKYSIALVQPDDESEGFMA